MGWSFEPTQLVPVVLGGVLYTRRARTLARRGRPVPPAKIAAFGLGLAVLVAAFELGGLASVWVAGAALANVFLWSDHPFYEPYVDAPRTWGLSALADQRAGGGVMLVEMMFVGAVVFVVLGLRWLGEAEQRQRRLEARGA